MMLSPESYYEIVLKGMNEEELRGAVAELEEEISRLRKAVEHPNYEMMLWTSPSEEVQLHYTRQYLKLAKRALAEAGAET